MALPHVAYFCMEMAIDQSVYIYSGGLGYLAGSHMRSAGQLGLPMTGVTIFWSHGYGQQVINGHGEIELHYNVRPTHALKDTGVTVTVSVFGEDVKVKVLALPASTFNTCPVYLLTTDIDENAEHHRQITCVLYDSDPHRRVSQEIVLGIGGLKALQALGVPWEVIHLNEGHALPAGFELLRQYKGDLAKLRQQMVFTTHTPVAAGNESHPAELLDKAGFFAGVAKKTAIELGGEDFSLTVAALRMSRIANGVSQLHGLVANDMWHWVSDSCPIIAITNAVNKRYWQDNRIPQATVGNDDAILSLKKTMKQELFSEIQEKTGKVFNPDVLTVVWARRFTEYKRAWMIFYDMERICSHLRDQRIQLIFAGKFHPSDVAGQQMFNTVLRYSRDIPNIAVMTNYELGLSARLKKGSDIWLNTPLRPLEASGTSGMSANMNGCLHCSIDDGWAVEGTFHGINGYLIEPDLAGKDDDLIPIEERHRLDYDALMQVLEGEIIPTYYHDRPRWAHLMRQAILTSETYFDSDRMVMEYYHRLYKPVAM